MSASVIVIGPRVQAIIAILLLAACPGSAADDPCAGVACSPGRTCISGTCWPGCGPDSPCPEGQVCIDRKCVGYSSDLGIPPDGAHVDEDGPVAKPDTAVDLVSPPPDAPPPDADPGKWYQVDSKNCPNHCSSIGRTNVKGPEGAKCMSGECRSKSGVDQGIKFLYGCSGTGTCDPQGFHEAVSVNQYCYKPAQKQDDDNTDLTVGCFCR